MLVFETIAVAFAMFSAIPVPQPAWDQRNMRYALCAFPLVGVVNGLGWWAWTALCGALQLPVLPQAAGLCLLPVAVTGGIHLDGYADTSDALASFAPPERRREILKDPRCGAFAVIRTCAYFVGSFALCGAVMPDSRTLLCMGGAFVLSRALSGISIASFPLAKDTGLAHTFAAAADKGRVRRALGAVALLDAGWMCRFGGIGGGAMVLAAAAVFGYYAYTAKKKFGGLSGDLAGWFLQKAEFWMLAALVLCQYGEALV
nr:adenosylcobinamide-GDP ribazoletransferase [uncultured Oscillibacter sp.]